LKLSLIVLNWNSYPHCKAFLESHQILTSNFSCEIVLVDGYSSDESLDLLKPLASIFLQSNKSRGLCRQLALEHATGDIIVNFVDVDKLMLPIMKDLVDAYIKYEDKTQFSLSLGGYHVSWRHIARLARFEDFHYGEDMHYLTQLYSMGKLRRIIDVTPCIHKFGHQKSKAGKVWREPLPWLDDESIIISRKRFLEGDF